jgi:hypothetical protein
MYGFTVPQMTTHLHRHLRPQAAARPEGECTKDANGPRLLCVWSIRTFQYTKICWKWRQCQAWHVGSEIPPIVEQYGIPWRMFAVFFAIGKGRSSLSSARCCIHKWPLPLPKLRWRDCSLTYSHCNPRTGQDAFNGQGWFPFVHELPMTLTVAAPCSIEPLHSSRRSPASLEVHPDTMTQRDMSVLLHCTATAPNALLLSTSIGNLIYHISPCHAVT